MSRSVRHDPAVGEAPIVAGKTAEARTAASVRAGTKLQSTPTAQQMRVAHGASVTVSGTPAIEYVADE